LIRNASTYLKFVHTPITSDDTYMQLSATDLYVYGLIIGVDDDSASATTGNWVGTSAAVTVANKNGVKITASQPLSISPMAVGREMLAVNLKDYFVATTSGDLIYVSYLEETAIT
jgi:hypothetical protein